MEQDSEWEKFVIPNLPKLVDCLRASLVLDHLRAKRLIAKEEYSAVRALSTEEERARMLFEILPTKGKDSYKQFCTIVEGITGQSHIVTDILRKTEREEAAAAAEIARRAESHELSACDIHNSGSARDEVAGLVSRGEEQTGWDGGGDPSDSTSLEHLGSPTKKFRHNDDDEMSSDIGDERLSSDSDLGALEYILDRQVTDKQMGIIKSLGGHMWRQFGRCLGFTDEDVTEIESRFPTDGNREKLHQILRRWKSRYGEKATLRKMLDACDHQDVDIKGVVVSKLRQQLRKQ